MFKVWFIFGTVNTTFEEEGFEEGCFTEELE
jgi:hypothetical protein